MIVANTKFIDASIESVNLCINEVFDKIASKVEPTYSHELANYAKEIFDSKGTVHGRNWQPNTESTAKRKDKNHRNVDTGELEDIITTDGFLMNDDYINELADYHEGYHFANLVGDGQNRFDDIGQREEDKDELIDRTVKTIIATYK